MTLDEWLSAAPTDVAAVLFTPAGMQMLVPDVCEGDEVPFGREVVLCAAILNEKNDDLADQLLARYADVTS